MATQLKRAKERKKQFILRQEEKIGILFFVFASSRGNCDGNSEVSGRKTPQVVTGVKKNDKWILQEKNCFAKKNIRRVKMKLKIREREGEGERNRDR